MGEYIRRLEIKGAGNSLSGGIKGDERLRVGI